MSTAGRCQRLALESHHRRSACRKSLQRSRTRGRDDGVTGAQPSRCSAARGCELGFSGVPSGRGWRRTRRRRAGGNGKRQYVAATRGGGTALLAPAPDADADARLDKTNPPSRKDTEQDKTRCPHFSSTHDWTNPSSSFLSPRCEIPVPLLLRNPPDHQAASFSPLLFCPVPITSKKREISLVLVGLEKLRQDWDLPVHFWNHRRRFDV